MKKKSPAKPFKKPFIIGVAGGTGSGKTTVVKNLIALIGPEHVTCISHDDYYKRQDHLTMEQRWKVNYDHPQSLDTKLMVGHLQRLVQGKSFRKPVYSFVECNRLDQKITIRPTPVVIIEGMLLYQYQPLREMFDLKVFVDTDADIRFIRKLKRDINERGRIVDLVIDQYTTNARPMHAQFIEPTKYYADVIIPEGGDNKVALDLLLARVKEITQAV